MSVTKLKSATSKAFLEANKEALVVLVFDAEFTGQQDIVDAALKALSTTKDLSSKIVLALVDVEQNNDLATDLSVVSVPMVICLKKGQVVKRIDTLDVSKLTSIVKEQLKLLELVTTHDSGEAVSSDSKETFKAYLTNLTTRADVMVFMKGNPESPRCGFSKTLVELLERNDIKYESFDILQDDEVRQGLKEFSNWPTYPQIYVKGEFVGGLDILKQMDEAGELEQTLKV